MFVYLKNIIIFVKVFMTDQSLNTNTKLKYQSTLSFGDVFFLL
tara:strand:- start:1538 stop:1666 length:129 start_codon:yes stop_codon:yes gene_type:complete